MSSFSLPRRFRPNKHGRAHSMLGNTFTDSLKKIGNEATGFVTRAVIDRINPPKVAPPNPTGLPDMTSDKPVISMPLVVGGVAGALLLVMLLSGGSRPAPAAA